MVSISNSSFIITWSVPSTTSFIKLSSIRSCLMSEAPLFPNKSFRTLLKTPLPLLPSRQKTGNIFISLLPCTINPISWRKNNNIFLSVWSCRGTNISCNISNVGVILSGVNVSRVMLGSYLNNLIVSSLVSSFSMSPNLSNVTTL